MKKLQRLSKFAISSCITHFRNSVNLYLGNNRSLPQAIDLYITQHCNLSCQHCFWQDHKKRDNELTTSQCFDVILRLKRWLGPFCLRIGGGEPLMRHDIFDILTFANKHGVLTILTTNATLIDEKKTTALQQSGLDILCISLDGIKEKTHDTIRGAGSYKKTIAAIQKLKTHLRIYINSVLIKPNLEEMRDIILFCQENKLLWTLLGFIPKEENNVLWPDDKDVIRKIFSNFLKDTRLHRTITNPQRHLKALEYYYLNRCGEKSDCLAFQRNCIIDPDGAMKFCGYFPPVGNVIDTDPKALWASTLAGRIKSEMKACARHCNFNKCYFYECFWDKTARFLRFLTIQQPHG